ncbi:MAG: N-acetylmuramoyl-L-alanine amidase, partial [Pseudomonadota bacterium]
MIRIILVCAALCEVLFLSMAVRAGQDARLLSEDSAVLDTPKGTEVRVALSEAVPFRVFTVDAPPRLVVDFKGVAVSDHAADLIGPTGAAISSVRFGAYRPGWSRFVAELKAPMLPQNIGMAVDAETGGATLALHLRPASVTAFTAAAFVPPGAAWPKSTPPSGQRTAGAFVVVLDPGHGGIDPGAERDGVSEKVLMLDFARELQAALEVHPDVDVELTRNADDFVALQARVALAHRVQADLFISLHADALSEGGAHGATIYTLSDTASDTASAHLAARHNRSDILAGIDLSGTDDQVTRVLLDLARRETEPRSLALAKILADH